MCQEQNRLTNCTPICFNISWNRVQIQFVLWFMLEYSLNWLGKSWSFVIKVYCKKKVKGALNSIELTNNSINVNLLLNRRKYCKTFCKVENNKCVKCCRLLRFLLHKVLEVCENREYAAVTRNGDILYRIKEMIPS